MERLERWYIIGDGIKTATVIVPDDQPLTVAEVLKLTRSESVVITIFDAHTGEFLGMAYAGHKRNTLEVVKYGRRSGDTQRIS